MTSHHSAITTFQIGFKGEPYTGEFFIANGRLITVSIAGRKRTTELRRHPPLVLAESVAMALLEAPMPPTVVGAQIDELPPAPSEASFTLPRPIWLDIFKMRAPAHAR